MQNMPSLRETVCHLVHRADFLLNRENSRALEPFGVTMYQAMGLIYVADHEQDRTVNQRALDPDDARSYALRTTHRGREQVEVFRDLILDTDRRLTRNLSAEERETLSELLHKINS